MQSILITLPIITKAVCIKILVPLYNFMRAVFTQYLHILKMGLELKIYIMYISWFKGNSAILMAAIQAWKVPKQSLPF